MPPPLAVLGEQPVLAALSQDAVADHHDLVGPQRGENLGAGGGEDFQAAEIVLRQPLLKDATNALRLLYDEGCHGTIRQPAEELCGAVLGVDFGGESVLREVAGQDFSDFCYFFNVVIPRNLAGMTVEIEGDLHGLVALLRAEEAFSREMGR